MRLPGPSHSPRPSSQDGRRGKDRERRALLWGLVLSGVIHLLLFGIRATLPLPPFSAETTAPAPDGLPLLARLIEASAPPDAPPVEQAPSVEVEPPPSAAPTSAPALPALPSAPPVELPPSPPDLPEEEEALTLAEQLTPRLSDPRLWAPLDELSVEMTDHEMAEFLLLYMLQSWNDSVAVAVALSDRATDWTFTDQEGRRWGLSPGRLHLGDFSIPLPFSFVPPQGDIQERLVRQWMLDDLVRGSQDAIIRDTWADRARAIRDRMEAVRGP